MSEYDIREGNEVARKKRFRLWSVWMCSFVTFSFLQALCVEILKYCGLAHV